MERIKGFDGIRAIAVLLVFLSHKAPGIVERLGLGRAGVRLFFALSGFLIIGILARRNRALGIGSTTLWRELRHFYANRLYRIWPTYFLYVALVCMFGMLGLSKEVPLDHVLGLVTFTANIWQGYVWPDWHQTTLHLWSIAVEEQFYLWAAPVFLLTPRRWLPHVCIAVEPSHWLQLSAHRSSHCRYGRSTWDRLRTSA